MIPYATALFSIASFDLQQVNTWRTLDNVESILHDIFRETRIPENKPQPKEEWTP